MHRTIQIRAISGGGRYYGTAKIYKILNTLQHKVPNILELFLFSGISANECLMDERILIKEVSEGNRSAFLTLMDVCLPLVSRTSYRIMCDRGDSEYITERVMLTLWREPMSFADDIRYELLRRTCHSCRIRLFRRRVLQLFSIDPDVYVASSPRVHSYDEYVARQAWQVFCRASSAFTDLQRVIYTLCELEQLPVGYVSVLTGNRPVLIERLLKSSRAVVEEELEHYGRIDDYEAYVGFIRKVEDQLTDKVGIQRNIMKMI